MLVANPPTYPNFLRFLKLLKIPILDTQMTFSVSRDRGAFEWAGDGLGAFKRSRAKRLNRTMSKIMRYKRGLNLPMSCCVTRERNTGS
jgi:predicted NAD/FAD-binding protein